MDSWSTVYNNLIRFEKLQQFSLQNLLNFYANFKKFSKFCNTDMFYTIVHFVY